MPLWFFLCLSAALSWTVWLWPTSSQAFFYMVFKGRQIDWSLTNAKLVFGNCLPGLLALVWVSVQGKQQIRLVLSSLIAWRAQPKWYVLSLVLPCGVFVAALLIVVTVFSARLNRPAGSVLVKSLLTLPFGPLWEEIAWRAFALRALQRRYSRLASALIIGVYWAVWHIPLWAVTVNYLTHALYLVICVNIVSWSVILAFLYNRSGESLPVVILLHATYNAAQNLVFAAIANVHLIPISAVLSVCVAFILAIWPLRTTDRSVLSD